MKSLSTFAVLAASIGLLLACQLQAKKPAKPNPQSDPHTVQLFMDEMCDLSCVDYVDLTVATCSIATSNGETIKPLLSGFCLDDDDFVVLELVDPLNPEDPPVVVLTRCCVTVHNKKGKVAGVTFFFGVKDIETGDDLGLHRTDFLTAYASKDGEAWTIHVNADCVDVWKEKGPGKGVVAGQVSIGGIVYTPAE